MAALRKWMAIQDSDNPNCLVGQSTLSKNVEPN
jgi:hypothetical protein